MLLPEKELTSVFWMDYVAMYTTTTILHNEGWKEVLLVCLKAAETKTSLFPVFPVMCFYILTLVLLLLAAGLKQ